MNKHISGKSSKRFFSFHILEDYLSQSLLSFKVTRSKLNDRKCFFSTKQPFFLLGNTMFLKKSTGSHDIEGSTVASRLKGHWFESSGPEGLSNVVLSCFFPLQTIHLNIQTYCAYFQVCLCSSVDHVMDL